jgi:hypothetical protein
MLNKMFWEAIIACVHSYYTDRIENDASTNSSIFSCLFLPTVKSLQSRCLEMIGGFLPNRCLTAVRRLLEQIYEVRRPDWLRCCVVHTKFHEDWFSDSKVDRGIHRHTDIA